MYKLIYKKFSRIKPQKMESSELFPVAADVVTSVLKVYNRTKESFQEDIDTLKEWMKTQSHLPELLDDNRIANFLILNKCSVERAKQKIDMYYTIRSLIPDFFEDSNPEHPNMQELTDIFSVIPLPQLTPEMYRVLIFKVRNKELADKLYPRYAVSHLFNVDEMRLKEDLMFGEILIADFAHVGASYYFKMTPTVLAKFFSIYEKVFSIPMKAVYIINSHPLIHNVVSAIKLIIKRKLFERIHICQDVSILHERLSKKILPIDYGGEEKSCEEIHEMVVTKMKAYKNRFDELDRLRVNESLRPAKLKNDEILGFHGNFKKLNVD